VSGQPPASTLPEAGLLADAGRSQPASALRLALPVACTLGRDCHILAYVDQLAGPAFQDIGGGRQTYDGHDGTDFGIASEAAMHKGVSVVAAAAGVVLWVRDGIADKRVVNPEQAVAATPLGCGNGVVIDHGRQRHTRYCHLRRGSVVVQPGNPVEQGAVLGQVGSSGLASFPHLHFGVSIDGRSVDPFLGSPVMRGDRAQKETRPLWDAPIHYVATGLIDAGFSDHPPDVDGVWRGALSPQALPADAPALVFWVHPFGVLAGDVEYMRLVAPGGETAVEITRALKSSNRINRVSLIGRQQAPGRAFEVGAWSGHYQLRREDRLLIDITREIDVLRH
jgi:murein DD-endopeptidase MepM/ murein hydrolase activator NlpD